MILRFVLRNFSRRKVRTVLMILSLMVSTGLIATMSATVETVRRSNVDLIASAVGRYDLSVAKRDTSPDPFLFIDKISAEISDADPRIDAVLPRIESEVELDANGEIGQGVLLALDPSLDDIGFFDVLEGEFRLGDGSAALMEASASNFGIAVGDSIDVSYSFPFPREVGKPAATGASERRTTTRFEIGSIVRQDGVTGGGVREGIVVHLADAQSWLGLEGRGQLLVATVDPAVYETNNAEVAALRMRDIVRNVQSRLGDEYNYALDKAFALNEAAQVFLLLQALINTYGLIALGVVGLLVHTLVMTNVQEQRRDMAVLRIIGGQRSFLFRLVIVEVITIGAIGVALGVGLGQIITRYVVVPIIHDQMALAEIRAPLIPQLTLSAILPSVLSAFTVLILSSLKPAQEAARTKVMHAINPGVADNIQIDDLARLRVRRPDFKLFLAGLGLMSIFALIAASQVIETFGGPALQAVFILLALGVLVLGLGMMFFITTVPFERLVLFVMGFLMPRLSYFAKRNVGRGQTRNTLISLLVLFSGVLPSFLATQLAMESANFEATVSHNMGAPANIRVRAYWDNSEESARFRLSPLFRTEELELVEGVDRTVGLTYGYQTGVSDPVGFKRASFTVYGVDGYLNDVLFTDLMEFVAGSPEALDQLLGDPEGIIISEGLAEHLAVGLGEKIRIEAQGRDHQVLATVIAVARTIPSIDGIGRSRNSARGSSDALMSLDGFHALTSEPNQPPPDAQKPVINRLLFTLSPGQEAEELADRLGKQYGREKQFSIRFLDIRLEIEQRGQATQRIFLLVLTMISFTTAVFGVFAVIYVTIYARRIEIGMMKAMGMKRKELTGMLILESITMTLGAALAGIAAGASMGYISFYGDRMLSQRPAIFAVDVTVIPFIAILVVLASMLGAGFSARRIVKKRAVEILRMQ